MLINIIFNFFVVMDELDQMQLVIRQVAVEALVSQTLQEDNVLRGLGQALLFAQVSVFVFLTRSFATFQSQPLLVAGTLLLYLGWQ